MQKFSLSYNPFRRQKGIPVLAQESECLSLCEGDVRWSGDIKNGKSISFSHPYLKWKTVRWRGDTLLEDHSYLLNDEHSPNVIDQAEANWLIAKIGEDGQIDKNSMSIFNQI